MSKTFPEGIFFNKPKEGAPDFVRGSISFNVDQAIEFLQKHKNEKGYVNVDMLLSKDKSIYLALNEWKPTNSTKSSPEAFKSESGLSAEDKAILDRARQIEIDAKAKIEITADEFYNSI
jgi:hypothetical protein